MVCFDDPDSQPSLNSNSLSIDGVILYDGLPDNQIKIALIWFLSISFYIVKCFGFVCVQGEHMRGHKEVSIDF